MNYATRIEVNRLCEELSSMVAECKIIRSTNCYYVRLNRRVGSPEVLMEWYKLTRKRAAEVGMDSRLFERTV
jgi:hypothetical protein